MWNAFTRPINARRSVLAASIALLLSGCASAPSQDPARGKPMTGNKGERSMISANAEPPAVKGRNAEDFANAVAAIKAGNLAEAERLLRRVTESQPELAGPWVNLGQVYLSLGQEEEARLAFRKAIAANPANCAAYNQLGVLSRQMGDFESAENHYLNCLSANPDSADVHFNLGILYELYLGRLADALSAYRRYQVLTDEPDRKVAGWVMDLERRTGE